MPDGRPTGEALVELRDESALAHAMTRHRELLGARYIELVSARPWDAPSRPGLFQVFWISQLNQQEA
jgi:hypothetical protein